MRIINSGKKKKIPLTNENINLALIKQTVIFGKKLEDKYINDKTYQRVRDHCQYTSNTEVLHIYSLLRDILVVFYNQLSHDDRFIIKELAKDFKGQFNCL